MTQSVIVEMRPRLQVCNVFLIMKEDLPKEDTVQINVKTSGVDVRWLSETGETVQVIDLHNYKLKPLSLSGLHIQKNSVSFRIQTEPAVNTSGSFASEILPFDKTLDIMSSDPELLSPNIPCGEPCSLACKCCGKLISKQGLSFSRVLPLPSTGELDNSDWFCHKHSSLTAPTLAPKDNDCFYGLCFILLSTLILNISPKRVLRCSRCLAWLGTCDSSTAKLWTCTTSYEGSSTSTPLEDFILTVKNAFNNTFGITCRVMLEVKLSDKDSQYLLLWAMDKNLDVLVSGGEDEFTSVKEKTEHLTKVKLECKLKVKKTVKLLYMYHKNCSDIVRSWQNDHNVQSVEIAKQMFTAGLEYLVKGTHFIPAPHKVTNNFFVTYLGL